MSSARLVKAGVPCLLNTMTGASQVVRWSALPFSVSLPNSVSKASRLSRQAALCSMSRKCPVACSVVKVLVVEHQGATQLVVTAERVESPLANVGSAISVVDGERIAARQAQAVLDILRRAA